MDGCLLPTPPPSHTQLISADDLNHDYYRNVDFAKENFKSESPPVRFCHRAFHVHAVTNFEWTTLASNSMAANRVASSAVACALFTLRTFNVKYIVPASTAVMSSASSVCLLGDLGTPRRNNLRNRSSVSPNASVAQTAPPTSRGVSVGMLEHLPVKVTEPFTTLDLARRFVSRGIELECAARSFSMCVRFEPVNCWFAEELASPAARTLAPEIAPAAFGLAGGIGDTSVLVLNVNAADINELSWLLGSVSDTSGACAFTRFVESTQPKDLYLELLEPIQSHPFNLATPWRTAWKWLSKPSLIPYARTAYLEAVALTWAPVPSSVEGTWIYKMNIIKDLESSPAQGGGLNSVSESCTGDEHRLEPRCKSSSASTGKVAIDACEEVIINMAKQAEDLALDQRRRGFVTFLWDVIAFWKGFYAILESDIANWMPGNEDLSVVGAAILRYRFCSSISTRVSLCSVVRCAWSQIHYSRLSSFVNSDIQHTVPSNLLLEIPPKLCTLTYKLKEVQKKDQILFYGYQLIPSECGSRNSFTFGISTGGLLSCAALSYLKEKNKYLFEVDEGFTCNVAYLGIIFEALQGTGIFAEYDEVWARFFLASPAVNALPDEPRRVFYRSCNCKRDRLKFTRQSAEVVACEGPDERLPPAASHQINTGLYKLLTSLSAQGGLLHLRVLDGVPTEYFIHNKAESGPFVGGNSLKALAKTPKRRARLVGRFKQLVLSPGVYKVKDLVGCLDQIDSAVEKLRISFLKKFTEANDEIEIYDVNDARQTQMNDLQCMLFETGEKIKVIQLSDD